ncbi:hypothetical protein OMP38_14440 [Cohnella ginsengisoli]|uniref:Uncharacterized protein n=1 Tax=Cohnella ginsengisoli TaxID=425004 RepID=A0A9X4QNU0_9BACL|nr:hypothetical protein [Cohnella ginsengisoli]MDG0791915.1 hypothetical protein [Cohnella ginsengisoli]
MDGYNIYIRLGANGIIQQGFTSAFEESQNGDILIQEGGPRHFSQVWPELLTNDRGQYRYKWQDGQRVERSQAELDAEWNARPPAPPTLEDQIKQMQQVINDLIFGGM